MAGLGKDGSLRALGLTVRPNRPRRYPKDTAPRRPPLLAGRREGLSPVATVIYIFIGNVRANLGQ
jgi:hypothetical protein